LESDQATKLKHKGKFAIQYSVGVKTKKNQGGPGKNLK
jgi:hypothetical protein